MNFFGGHRWGLEVAEEGGAGDGGELKGPRSWVVMMLSVIAESSAKMDPGMVLT